MNEGAQIALVAIGALLVGTLMPVLMTLRSTLKDASRAIGKAEKLLSQSGEVMTKVDAIVEEFRHGAPAIGVISKTLNELAFTLSGMQRSMRVAGAVASAVGPAIVAAVSSFRGTGAQAEVAGNGSNAPGTLEEYEQQTFEQFQPFEPDDRGGQQ